VTTRIDDESIPGPAALEKHVRVVRLGYGANCSSVGSVVDTLFVVSAVSGALLAAIAAALTRERVHVVGREIERESTETETETRARQSERDEQGEP
jgi:hypothetical protein